ncbi:MAG: recombinase family protein, partial [Sphaerochaeta sp.]|nr:recombinase family protein [Sphaerochaeta sp.]
LETLRIPSPRGKRKWAVRTISDMLSNEKYAGDSAYGKTVIAEYPSMRQVRNNPDQVSRAENHHPAIIDKVLFGRVLEMKKSRTNIELDEHGNKIRKSTRYSMKRPLALMKDQTETEEA